LRAIQTGKGKKKSVTAKEENEDKNVRVLTKVPDLSTPGLDTAVAVSKLTANACQSAITRKITSKIVKY